MTDALIAVAVLSLVNGIVTTIVTEGSIFEPVRFWFRDRAGAHDTPYDSPAAFVSGIVECALCASVWVGLVLALLIFPLSTAAFWREALAYPVLAFASAAGGHFWRRHAWL